MLLKRTGGTSNFSERMGLRERFVCPQIPPFPNPSSAGAAYVSPRRQSGVSRELDHAPKGRNYLRAPTAIRRRGAYPKSRILRNLEWVFPREATKRLETRKKLRRLRRV
jgi:hypothetical protein